MSSYDEIKCPCCGSVNSLDSLVENKAVSSLLLAALRVTPVGVLIIKYLGLFRPDKRQLTWTKTAKLLEELMPMIEFQRIHRGGVAYLVNNNIWERALTQVLDARDKGALKLPFKSHGYLLEVVVSELNKDAKEAEDERIKQRRLAKEAEDRAIAAQQQRQAEKQKPVRVVKSTIPADFSKVIAEKLAQESERAKTLTPEQRAEEVRKAKEFLQLHTNS